MVAFPLAMRKVFISLVGAFLLPVTIAFAMVPRGPPPWTCQPHAACNGDDVCVPIFGPPMSFEVRLSADADVFVLKGLRGGEQLARQFPSLGEAQRFVESDERGARVSMVLIPNDLVADAKGFWAHSVFTRGSGGRLIWKDRVLISCIDMRP